MVKFGADAKDAAAKVKDEATFKAVFPKCRRTAAAVTATYRKKAS